MQIKSNLFNSKTISDHLSFTLFCVILIASFYVFKDAIFQSIFLLDDFHNLARLNQINSLSDTEAIAGFIFNGISGATGRPISLVTFALQHNAWPDHPFYFKLFNLCLHLINSYLVYSILSHIFNLEFKRDLRTNSFLAFVGASIWMLHPIQISTFLYTIQRMTELSAFFVFTGLLFYLKGRCLLSDTSTKKQIRLGYILITTGVFIGAYIGVFAKENAILLCVYILALEYTIYQNHRSLNFLWKAIFLYSPLVLLSIYLAYRSYPYIIENYPLRTFSAYERMITQFRVLLDYMLAFYIPQPSKFGLFHTDYEISTSLFEIRSLLASALILTFLSLGLYYRKKNKLLSFGILLFFSAHLLESTFVNLELYFEHRNYVAIIGLIIISLLPIFYLKKQSPHKNSFKLLIYFAFTIWYSLIVIIAFYEARLWANPLLQAESWHKQQPNSIRAFTHFNSMLVLNGQYSVAYNNFKVNFDRSFKHPEIATSWLELTCFAPNIPPPPYTQTIEILSQSVYSNGVLSTLNQIASLQESGMCLNANRESILSFLDALSTSVHYKHANHQRLIYIIKSKYYVLMNEHDNAINMLSKANDIKQSADIFLSIASLHINDKHIQNFDMLMSKLLRFCNQRPIHCLQYNNEIESLKLSRIQLHDNYHKFHNEN
jgi:hypothetical protein